MGYYIYTWFDNGNPQIQVVEAQSKKVCLSWSYQAPEKGNKYDKKEIQRLFKDLLLLTCKQKMENYRVFGGNPVEL